MENSGIILTVSVVAIIMLLIWSLMLFRSRRVNLTSTSPGEKPEWMRSTPPPETTTATEAEGEGITLYNYDKGENLAAPFAEQIEDILRAQMNADPHLSSYQVDFGTASNGGLEIHIGEESYTSIEQIPDERLRAAIQQAIATYNQRGK